MRFVTCGSIVAAGFCLFVIWLVVFLFVMALGV